MSLWKRLLSDRHATLLSSRRARREVPRARRRAAPAVEQLEQRWVPSTNNYTELAGFGGTGLISIAAPASATTPPGVYAGGVTGLGSGAGVTYINTYTGTPGLVAGNNFKSIGSFLVNPVNPNGGTPTSPATNGGQLVAVFALQGTVIPLNGGLGARFNQGVIAYYSSPTANYVRNNLDTWGLPGTANSGTLVGLYILKQPFNGTTPINETLLKGNLNAYTPNSNAAIANIVGVPGGSNNNFTGGAQFRDAGTVSNTAPSGFIPGPDVFNQGGLAATFGRTALDNAQNPLVGPNFLLPTVEHDFSDTFQTTDGGLNSNFDFSQGANNLTDANNFFSSMSTLSAITLPDGTVLPGTNLLEDNGGSGPAFGFATAIGSSDTVATLKNYGVNFSNNSSTTGDLVSDTTSANQFAPGIEPTAKASPSIVTSASFSNNSNVVGTAVLTDSATLSGSFNGTGTITFTLTLPDGSTVSEGSVTVNGDGTYTAPNTVLATEVGTYTWHATYSGDSLNNGAIDNGNNESLTTVKTTPQIVTTASFTNNSNVVGTAIMSDSATLTGTFNGTGTITFTLTQPDGSTVSEGSVTVNGDGTYTAPNTVLATEVGTYTWHASYSGDTLNNGAVDNGNNESLTTVKTTPQIVTTASFTNNSNVVGTAIMSDSATLTGTFNGTGTITFTLTQPDGSTVSEGSVTVNGDGTYTAPNTVLATEVGTYTWHATYSGDSLNNGAIDNGNNESLTTVKTTPQIVTTADPHGTQPLGANGTLLNDSAVLSGTFNGTGTIVFQLHSGTNTGTVLYTDTVVVSGNGTYNTATMGDNPGGFNATAAGTYVWTATYSGDTLNNGAIDNGTSAQEQVTLQQTFHGLTPGFWKNNWENWNGSAWQFTYNPFTKKAYKGTDTLKSAFNPSAALLSDPNYAALWNLTLDDALNFGGGNTVTAAAQILLRQAVAALLNATYGTNPANSNQVTTMNYPLTQAQIVSQVTTALATDSRDAILALANTLDRYNNFEGFSIQQKSGKPGG